MPERLRFHLDEHVNGVIPIALRICVSSLEEATVHSPGRKPWDHSIASTLSPEGATEHRPASTVAPPGLGPATSIYPGLTPSLFYTNPLNIRPMELTMLGNDSRRGAKHRRFFEVKGTGDAAVPGPA